MIPRSRAVLLVIVAALLAACSVASVASPAPSTSRPSAGPSGSSPADFYLRAWRTQALEPRQTFTWLPVLTITGGKVIDGQVAIPAIYPGPLYVPPMVRAITSAGISAIVAEARREGLLGSKTDFAETPMPGATLAHLEFSVDGTRYELTGDPDSLSRCRCIPDAGTAGAFAAFWQRITALGQWIPSELGGMQAYTPERLAVRVTDPVEVADGPIAPNEVTWPLASFATFGRPAGADRCAVVSGPDLARLLPAVRAASQLTRFVDSTGGAKSLLVRAMVPGEPDPCPA